MLEAILYVLFQCTVWREFVMCHTFENWIQSMFKQIILGFMLVCQEIGQNIQKYI